MPIVPKAPENATSRPASLRFWLVSFLALVLVGCQMLRPMPLVDAPASVPVSNAAVPVSKASVHGRVNFSGRTTQATPADVVNAATVSFIDTGSNQTVATGKTDAAGNFTLSLGGYSPVNGGTYLLEAVKGLNAQAPGSYAARFRTLLQWNGTGWVSCTNNAVPGTLVINSLTTALTIETALDPANIPAANTIGKVNAATNPATLNATPGPYTNHPDSEITQLGSDLLAYLGADTDPMASVPSIAPAIASFQPTSAGANSLVKISGAGFSPVPSGNIVTFNGASAQVILATPTSLVVVVPAGATTGTLRVQTGRGSVNSGTPFTVGALGAGGLEISGFSPAFGRADTVVTLSGSFGTGTATPTVTFTGPSNVAVQASVSAWSATSMTVAVPIGAVPGAISVQSGASATTAPGSFDVWQGDVSWMTNLTPSSSQSVTGYSLPNPLHGAACAAWGSPPRYMYIANGWNGAAPGLPEVRVVTINPDGSLGNMRQVGETSPRWVGTAVVWGNYLYLFGGHNGAAMGSVERATINPADGSLGPFTSIGSLPVPRWAHGTVVYGNNIYVLAGYDGSAARSDYYRYTVDPANGNLSLALTGTLTVGGTPFTIDHFGYTVVGDHLVIVGGYLNSTYSRRSITLPINLDGTLGDGTYNPTDLNQGYHATQVAVVNDEIYAIGGHNGTTYHSAIAHAPINPITGAIGAWVYDSPGQPYHTNYNNFVLTIGNRLYTFGGYTNIGSGATVTWGAHSIIQSATVQTNKSLSRWASYGGVSMPTHSQCGQVIGNKAWLIGGYNYILGYPFGRNTEYFTLYDDGTMGPSTKGPELTSVRHWASSLVVNDFLYVLGGYDGSVWTNTIERAQILPDGTLGAFVPLAAKLAQYRGEFAVARVGKYVYALGGYIRGEGDTIERAEVLADGSLGPFELQKARLPGTSRLGFAVVVGNYLYFYRGYNGSAASSEIWMAAIDADGSIGRFTPAPSLNVAVYSGTFDRIGNYLYCFGGWNGSPASLVQRSRINPDGTLNAWQNYQPGGRDIMPSGSSHWNAKPYVYKDSVYLFSGYNGVAPLYNIDAIFQGTVH